jgi:hypothetical protein
MIEDGLSLISIEKYIPKGKMTRSFIDILAKDKSGNWVIIEIKKSDATAREAMHEIIKYVEAVRSRFTARDNEMRIIIISTHWAELIGPFSKFAAETSFNVEGLQLSIEDDYSKFDVERVKFVELDSGRMFAPWHEVNFYTDEVSLERGLKEYQQNYEKKKIEYYVFVIFEAPEGLFEKQIESLRQTMNTMNKNEIKRTEVFDFESFLSRLQRHNFVIYCAHKQLSDIECIDILREDPDFDPADFDHLEGEEKNCTLHEYCFSVEPRPHFDRYEIGYPAKLSSRFLRTEGWILKRIVRGGRFSLNSVLQDEEIISELSGYTGSSWQRFKRTIHLSNKAQVALARSEIKTCLSNNPAWQQNVLHHFEEMLANHRNCTAEISIHNPTSGLFTLYFAATQQMGVLFVPTYSIILKDGNLRRMYCGHLAGSPTNISFGEILSSYYNADLFNLLHIATFGYYEPRDTEILEDIGLVYSSFRCDRTDDKLKFFQLKNGRWRSIPEFEPFASFFEFLNGSDKLVYSMIRKMQFRFNGGLINADSSTLELDKICDEEKAKVQQNYYQNAPDRCDLCEISFEGEKYLIDGKIKKHRMWACLCVDCFNEEGSGIGWGVGQLYRKTSEDSWLQVSGFRPYEDCES